MMIINKTKQFEHMSLTETRKYPIVINIQHYNGHRNEQKQKST